MEGSRDWDTRWERLEIGWKELGLHGRGQREGSGTVWEGFRWVGGAETGGGEGVLRLGGRN